MSIRIEVDQEKIANVCLRHSIASLAFFGSVLGNDFRPDSDVDVLVEFEAGMEPGLLAMAELERELTGILGRQAHLRTAEDLSRYFRERVVSEAEVQYAA